MRRGWSGGGTELKTKCAGMGVVGKRCALGDVICGKGAVTSVLLMFVQGLRQATGQSDHNQNEQDGGERPHGGIMTIGESRCNTIASGV
jgi:hypothetical protein